MRSPVEAQEARWLMEWVRLHEKRFPNLSLFFHIANESPDWKRRAIMAGQGVRNGVPDYFLPVPQFRSPIRVQCSNGLFLELKRQRGGRLSPEQQQWIERLQEHGYTVAVCAGWQEAAQALVDYLQLPLRVLEARCQPPPLTTSRRARQPSATASQTAAKREGRCTRTPRPGAPSVRESWLATCTCAGTAAGTATR